MVVTIRAEAKETDKGFTVDDKIEIRVGQYYSMMFPKVYASGYCVSMRVIPKE